MYGLEDLKRLNSTYAERADYAERTAKRDRRIAALSYAALLEDERPVTQFDLGIIEEYLGYAPGTFAGPGLLTASDYEYMARQLRQRYENAE